MFRSDITPPPSVLVACAATRVGGARTFAKSLFPVTTTNQSSPHRRLMPQGQARSTGAVLGTSQPSCRGTDAGPPGKSRLEPPVLHEVGPLSGMQLPLSSLWKAIA